jgi:hypothetical protein
MLRNNPSLAIAEPASPHPAVRGVAHVVTNHATGLYHPSLSRLLVVHGARDEAGSEEDVLLAVAGSVGQGRLLALGDGSVAINAMMRYPGNRALCTALIRYATEDETGGTRDGKLYIVSNDFETSGSFGGDAGQDAGFGGLVSQVRRRIVEALEMLRNEGMPPVAAYLLAIAGGLGIVAWVSTRAGKTHRATSARYARPAPTSEQGGVAGRAALVGAPGTSRLLAMLEWKSALEEDLATRLGFDKVPGPADLVVAARARGMLSDAQAAELSALLARLARLETMLELQRRGAGNRVRDADVLALSARVRALLDAAHAPTIPASALVASVASVATAPTADPGRGGAETVLQSPRPS